MNAAPDLPAAQDKLGRWLFRLTLLVYFLVVPAASKQTSPTFDEPAHLRAGVTMLSGGRYIDPETAWWTAQDPMLPPVDALPAALAWAGGLNLDQRGAQWIDFGHIVWGRWMNHLAGALVLILVYRWIGSALGATPGAFAALAVLTNPLFLAHATIVSTDLYMLLCALLVSHHWWRAYMAAARPRKAPLRCDLEGGILLAASICMKLTNLLFVLLLPLPALVAAYRMRRDGASLARSAGRALTLLGVNAGIGIGLSAVVYELTQLGVTQTVFGEWPLPFGLGEKLLNAVTIARGLHVIFPPVYWFGELVPGSWRHYLIMCLARMPVGLLLLWLLAPYALRRAPLSREQRRLLGFLLLLCAASAAFFATRGFYVGVRHLIFPIVGAGAVGGAALAAWTCRPKRQLAAGLLLACGIALPVLAAWPWYLSYVNVFGRGELTFEADGDWGQGLLALQRWQRATGREDLFLSYFGSVPPEQYGVRYGGMLTAFTPQQTDKRAKHYYDPARAQGIIALSATSLTGRYLPHAKASPDHYARWRTERPLAVVGGSIYLYDAAAVNDRSAR